MNFFFFFFLDQIGAIFNRGAKKSFLCASLAIDFISFLLDLRKSKEREQENVCNKLKDSLGVLVRTKSWSDAASVPKISLQVLLLLFVIFDSHFHSKMDLFLISFLFLGLLTSIICQSPRGFFPFSFFLFLFLEPFSQ